MRQLLRNQHLSCSTCLLRLNELVKVVVENPQTWQTIANCNYRYHDRGIGNLTITISRLSMNMCMLICSNLRTSCKSRYVDRYF
jgi:hypothetical protein